MTVTDAARDQNGNRLSPRTHRVRALNGDETGYARQVWFGWNPATEIRCHVYKTRDAARKGDISDTHANNPALIATSIEGWKPVSKR